MWLSAPGAAVCSMPRSARPSSSARPPCSSRPARSAPPARCRRAPSGSSSPPRRASGCTASISRPRGRAGERAARSSASAAMPGTPRRRPTSSARPLSGGGRRRLPLSRLSRRARAARAPRRCSRTRRSILDFAARALPARRGSSRSASASAAASPPRSPRRRPLAGLILVTPFDSLAAVAGRPLSLAAGPAAVPPPTWSRPRTCAGSPRAGRDHRRRARHADPARAHRGAAPRRRPISPSTGPSPAPATTTSTSTPASGPAMREALRRVAAADELKFPTCSRGTNRGT